MRRTTLPLRQTANSNLFGSSRRSLSPLVQQEIEPMEFKPGGQRVKERDSTAGFSSQYSRHSAATHGTSKRVTSVMHAAESGLSRSTAQPIPDLGAQNAPVNGAAPASPRVEWVGGGNSERARVRTAAL